ncbi:uncharacterized protein LOC114259103 [Camellia sinensis]|uniref:uncharacterized protein LOC114259103 n=1 Tax=Camellia sinensis TaxID=4442 RepID=UPI001036881D|nr:uncharacterized protein LOC114259103 [Camellia sinensis]
MYMHPDRVIEQIPLERIEKRDRRLAFAPGIEQIPRVYADNLHHTIDILLLMVQRRLIALVTHGIELESAPTVPAEPPAASRRRRGPVRGRGGVDRGRQCSLFEESFARSMTPKDEGEEVDL